MRWWRARIGSRLDAAVEDHVIMSPRMRLLIVAGAVIAFVVPVLIAFHLARVQAIQADARYALELARSAIAQVELTGDQLVAASATINALSPEEACAPAGLDVLRRIDLQSTLLQGVGRVEGNVLRCSSFAGNTPYPMGPVDTVTTNGTSIRTRVPIIDPALHYIVIQLGNAAVVVHPDLALSFVPKEPALGIVAFTWSERTVIARRGTVRASLLSRTLVPGAVARLDGSTTAVVRSARGDTGVMVVLPPGHFAVLGAQAGRQLVPAGILGGAIIAALFILAARNRASIGGMIRSALTRRLFHLCYQPIIALETGRVVGVEALLRWRRDKGREIAPDIFIPVAEQRGLMPALTARVLELLEQDLPELLAVAPDLEIAINFTAGDLCSDDLAQSVRAFAGHAGISPARIVVEATERSLLDPRRVGASLGALRESGVRVAIDDFGTGYSSLAYLAEMEVDIVKIDKLFVQALGTGSATSQVAQGVIEMARALDLTTVAEGIETAAQADIVRALGVSQAQGYYYARPLPLAQIMQFLRERALVVP